MLGGNGADITAGFQHGTRARRGKPEHRNIFRYVLEFDARIQIFGAHFDRRAQQLLDGARGFLAGAADRVKEKTFALFDQLPAVERLGGVVHGTNQGEVSWFEFARAVLEAAGLDAVRQQTLPPGPHGKIEVSLWLARDPRIVLAAPPKTRELA